MQKIVKKTALTSNPKGVRYDALEKDFYAYRFIQGGRALYDFDRSNCPSPHIRTIQRFLKTNSERMEEGILMIKKLKSYLLLHKYPLVVSWSEDATRITGGVEYKPQTDELTGLVVPLNKSTGLPSGSMKCPSPQAVLDHLKRCPVARNVQLTLVQPLVVGAAPFCVNYYCTDNKFTAEDVKLKWEYANQLFEQEGIQIASKATDGDSRFIRAMLDNMQLPTNNKNSFGDWFASADNLNAVYIQDPTHIANKFRTRLINPAKNLIIGQYRISKIHLEELIASVSKDQHGLVIGDLSEHDKMKFRPVEKMTAPEVINGLQVNIPFSAGTIEFLKVCSFAMTAFLNADLSPTERLLKICSTTNMNMVYYRKPSVGGRSSNRWQYPNSSSGKQ